MKNKVSCIAWAMSGALLLGGCGAKTLPQEDFNVSEGMERPQEQMQESEEQKKQQNNEAGGAGIEAGAIEGIIEGSAPAVTVTKEKKEWYTDDGKTLLLQAEADIVNVAGGGFDALQSAFSKHWSGVGDSYDELVEIAREDYNSREGEDQTYFFEYSSIEGVTLTRSDSTVVSFYTVYSDYTGGAHGNYGLDGVSFDVESGKELELGDILSDAEGFYGEAAAYLVEKLEENYGDGLFPDYAEYVAGTFDEGGTPCWYLDGTGIVIMYSPYEIGPYAMGAAEVTLPYAEFAQYIKEAYVTPHNSMIAKISANQDLSVLLGEPIMLDFQQNEYDLGEATVVSETSSDEIGTFSSFESGYVMRREDGRSFLLAVCDYMSDDYGAFVYEVTDGRIQKCDELTGAQVNGAYMGVDRIGMSLHLDVLGTYQGSMEYILDEDGKFIQTEDTFAIDTTYAMTIMKELPVVMNGSSTTMGIGTQIMITGTNNTDTAYFKVAGSNDTGEIKYVRDDAQWQLLIDGVSEYEYFDMVPYVG